MQVNVWQQVTDASPRDGAGRSLADMEGWASEHERRDGFIERFSFAVPSKQAVRRIKEFVGERRLLEVGAGTGLWARLLSEAGVAVTAVDNASFRGRVAFAVGSWYEVERLEALLAVSRYADHAALMLCWPDYDTPMAADALAAFQGDRLVYIGEGESGCTGDERE